MRNHFFVKKVFFGRVLIVENPSAPREEAPGISRAVAKSRDY